MLKGRHVLVVDDESMIRLMMADEFEHQGCRVSEAGDGEEALGLLSADGPIDLLVTDVRMPGIDGWVLAERARAIRPGLPIVYVTGFSGVDPRPVDGARVLSKPFLAAHLVAAATDVMTS